MIWIQLYFAVEKCPIVCTKFALLQLKTLVDTYKINVLHLNIDYKQTKNALYSSKPFFLTKITTAFVLDV